jgi:hypothetical protein
MISAAIIAPCSSPLVPAKSWKGQLALQVGAISGSRKQADGGRQELQDCDDVAKVSSSRAVRLRVGKATFDLGNWDKLRRRE